MFKGKFIVPKQNQSYFRPSMRPSKRTWKKTENSDRFIPHDDMGWESSPRGGPCTPQTLPKQSWILCGGNVASCHPSIFQHGGWCWYQPLAGVAQWFYLNIYNRRWCCWDWIHWSVISRWPSYLQNNLWKSMWVSVQRQPCSCPFQKYNPPRSARHYVNISMRIHILEWKMNWQNSHWHSNPMFVPRCCQLWCAYSPGGPYVA